MDGYISCGRERRVTMYCVECGKHLHPDRDDDGVLCETCSNPELVPHPHVKWCVTCGKEIAHFNPEVNKGAQCWDHYMWAIK